MAEFTSTEDLSPWTPEDFITQGIHCPIAALRNQINKIRFAAGAEWLFLLVFQDEPVNLEHISGRIPYFSINSRFFQSLVIFNHSNDFIHSQIEPHLIDRSIIKTLELPEHSGDIQVGNLIKAATIPSRWDLLLNHLKLTDTINVLWLPIPAVVPNTTPSTGYPARICLLANGLTDPSNPTLVSLLQTLVSMVNACAPVVVHRSLGRVRVAECVMTHYEQRFEIERLVRESGSSDNYRHLVEQFGKSVLTAALTLTGSSTGNLYLSTSDQRRLRLTAQVNNEHAIHDLSTEQRRSVVSFVYSTAKPLLVNDLDEFKTTHPTIKYEWVGSHTGDKKPYAELAIPIIQPNPGSSTPNILGVLNVEKVSPDDVGHFTDHDLTILRMLAVRFCLWRVRLSAAMVSRSLSSLTPSGRIVQPLTSTANIGRSDVPFDFWPVRDHLSEVLRHAYDLTRSKTATIRLLSTDGLRLIRFCAWPLSAMGHPHDAILIARKDSVNAFVARSGQPCYIPELGHSSSLISKYPDLIDVLKSREGIRSEYCLPIVARNRLLGTVNLESEYVDAYSGESHFLDAIIEQVRLALLFSQAQHEQSVIAVTARISLNTHEIMKCVGRLVKLSAKAPDSLSSELRTLSQQLKDAIGTASTETNTARDVGDRPKLIPIRDLIMNIAINQNIAHRIKWGRSAPDVPDVFNESIAPTLTTVLGEILYNSFLKATGVPDGVIWISLATILRGGRSYLALRISHPLAAEISQYDASRIYRVPIKKADRDHIGAYLAGAAVRALGGDINFAVDSQGFHARTTIEIPMSVERP